MNGCRKRPHQTQSDSIKLFFYQSDHSLQANMSLSCFFFFFQTCKMMYNKALEYRSDRAVKIREKKTENELKLM